MGKKACSGTFSWKLFGIVAFCLSWCKHALAVSLPVYALADASFDDRLMVNLAYWIMNGQWLGTYNSNTFVKGVGFPVFLAITRFIGFSYLSAISLFYIVACLLTIVALRPVLKKTWQGIFLYGVLLFNPETISYTTQRVYRNSITPSQVLLILVCFLAYQRGCHLDSPIFVAVCCDSGNRHMQRVRWNPGKGGKRVICDYTDLGHSAFYCINFICELQSLWCIYQQ